MKNRPVHAVLGALFLLLTLSLSAQEQIGFHTDNYSGINSIRLNPAGYAQSPYGWDINLGEAGFFFDNNYVFIRPASVSSLLQNGETANFIFAPDQKGELPLGTNDYLIDFNSDGKKRYLYHNAQILGPSFFVKLNQSNYVGVSTGFRTAGSASGITESLSYYTYHATPFYQDIAIDKFNMGFLSWGELGLNYIHKTETQDGDLAIGATVKHLTGFEAGYFYSDSDWSLQKRPNDTLSSESTTLYMGYTNSNLSATDVTPSPNGNGWAFDLGVTYTISSYADEYDWKFGASLLDIGRIKFNKNAKSHVVQTDQLAKVALDNYDQYKEIGQLEDLVAQFSQDVQNDPNASINDTQFSVWLPGAISLQAERAITPSLFVNATWLQGLPMGKPGVRRGAVLAITPRLEKKWYGISFPVSIYNYQHLRTGFALRLAFLTIGSDHLGSLVHRSKFAGTDIYMAIKLNPFGLQGLFKKRGGGHRVHRSGRKGKEFKCYEF